MIRFRELLASDEQLLASATLENLNWSGPRFTAEQVRSTSGFAHYWAGPPGPHDLGLVAEQPAPDHGDSRDASAVGVAWLRHLPATDPGYGFVDSSIPELSLWVRADCRGRGIGGRLLIGLLERAEAAGLPGVSLSVEHGNPARRLYERAGFVPAGVRPDGTVHDNGTLLRQFCRSTATLRPVPPLQDPGPEQCQPR